MLKKLERYVKNDHQGYLKLAMFLGYSDTAPIRNWVRRKSIPKHMELRLKSFLQGEKNVKVYVE